MSKNVSKFGAIAVCNPFIVLTIYTTKPWKPPGTVTWISSSRAGHYSCTFHGFDKEELRSSAWLVDCIHSGKTIFDLICLLRYRTLRDCYVSVGYIIFYSYRTV